MASFVGQHLEEMADMRSARKCKVVLLCSVIALVILTYYGSIHIANQNYLFGTLNMLCVAVLSANLWYLRLNQSANFSDLVLSCVLLFQGMMLLLFGEHISDRLLWLYPIMAAVIFVCEFRYGLLFSSSFYVLTMITCLFTDLVSVPLQLSVDRFLISLFALCLLCNTSSYFYSKVVNYIQSLYKEGIEDLAYRDQLTGLANRWSFESWAMEKLEEVRANKTVTAMVFLDIDNFKAINDTYGHDVGDRVLQHFSKRLKNNIRSKDRKTQKHDYSIARYAGDEFVLLLYDVRSIKDLNNILERICHLFEDSYQSTERINKLTVSAGVAIFPTDGDSLPELTRCADKAMYAAKHNGKNQYRYYQRDHAGAANTIKSTDAEKVTPINKFNGS
ncbi:GGDEF domain-containing protein [Vibrio coralliilyticus]|uniref:Diguanylate cyclase n=1 Tax=Vibrio coralliilyticus TaxID=190893 RepID=A0AAJ3BA58_9VIBR|nr:MULTISPECIES: GGDEF domain-containing protein [Vibrio]AIW21754.1 diguanylate cyclase [Vibrio coralliilyticus]NOH38939.1 GGDEF domain-containing protein [Vibrio coralliilyticus]NOI76134.1 GGDEF domain-containing protein [Vibrio coralliilyticus]NOJ23817.1 GGDEF domain-containing protein [Vibrio coralliilyticus]PAW03836.1 GGDEF domain-containing protein [Vibrio coralliilyticus]